MPFEEPAQESSVQNLREEFDRLRCEQDEAMKLAVYVGMSAKEAKEYENRRKRLTELFKRLYILKP